MADLDPVQRIAALEKELAETRARLDERDRLLRRAMEEKGEMLLRQLEESHARAHREAEAARRDPQTDLFRHGQLRTRLGFEIERRRATGEPLALVLLDLDGFGRFNRERGYAEGDRVLANIGRGLQSLWLARPSKRPPVLAREAADTFAALLPCADADEAEGRAEAMRDLVERLPIGEPRLTASVGAAVVESGDVEADALLGAAFDALSRAFAEGRNRVHLVRLGEPRRASAGGEG